MDNSQKEHLKAYGIVHWLLKNDIETSWLLNYRGGSFMCEYHTFIQKKLTLNHIVFEVISNAQAASVVEDIIDPTANYGLMKLAQQARIAVYSPKSKQPWDDAVTLALTYADIPYDIIFDDEIMNGELLKYDWIHLHHEDFTGQYGKFYAHYANAPWYILQQRESEKSAQKNGFRKVSKLKLAVAKKIKEFVAGGGFLFAMCSATDSFDIALAAEETDLCGKMFDGDAADPQAQEKLNYEKTLAFTDFRLFLDPYEYEFSDIDNNPRQRRIAQSNDFFTLFEFSAKWDPIPTLLTQNHTKVIKGFYGQTTGYKKNRIKPEVLILGENKDLNEAKYIHGMFGKGFYTFYGGHDPEDYQHIVGEDPTDLTLHPNSPGYRLILNNILFPSAKKKKRKT